MSRLKISFMLVFGMLSVILTTTQASSKLQINIHPKEGMDKFNSNPTIVSQTETLTSPRMLVEVFKSPKGLGVKNEFLTITIDGHLERISVISSPLRGKSTVDGIYTLKPMLVVDKEGEYAPFPWLKVRGPTTSTMYWGLQIKDVYFLHATPHYEMLGQPASDGCIRVNYPTAMEIFDDVVNRVNGSAEIHIYRSGSAEAKRAFEEKNLDVSWVNQQIQSDLRDAWDVGRRGYYGYGHARRGEALVFPECGNSRDCFSIWGMKKPN